VEGGAESPRGVGGGGLSFRGEAQALLPDARLLGREDHLLEGVKDDSGARRGSRGRNGAVGSPAAEHPDLVPDRDEPSFDVTELSDARPHVERPALLVSWRSSQDQSIPRHDHARPNIGQSGHDGLSQRREIKGHGFLIEVLGLSC
jgi:hypothetical protein